MSRDIEIIYLQTKRIDGRTFETMDRPEGYKPIFWLNYMRFHEGLSFEYKGNRITFACDIGDEIHMDLQLWRVKRRPWYKRIINFFT